MKWSQLRPLAFVAILLLVVGSAVASSGYTVESTTTIDTPSRTVTLQGTDYTVTLLGYRDVGETLPVVVSRPGDESFTVQLYNSDRDIVDAVEGSDNGTYTLDETTSLERGTYVLALTVDGSIKTIQPVVLSGYDITVDAPDSVSADEQVSITIKLSGDTPRPDYVDVAVLNNSTHRYTTTRIDNRTYNVIISDLAPDDYRLYATTRNADEEVNGRDEATGVSSVHRLNITADEKQSTTESPPTTTAPAGGAETQSGTSTSATERATTASTAPITTSTTERNPPSATTVSPPTSPGDDADVSPTTQQFRKSATTRSEDTASPTPTGTPSGETAATTPMFPHNVLGAFVVLLLLARGKAIS